MRNTFIIYKSYVVKVQRFFKMDGKDNIDLGQSYVICKKNGGVTGLFSLFFRLVINSISDILLRVELLKFDD